MNKTETKPVEYTDIAIDLETLDTSPTAVFFALSAVAFNRNTGQYQSYDKSLNMFVNIDSCLRNGQTVSGNTLMWWLSQSDDARQSMQDGYADAQDIENVMIILRTFYTELAKHTKKILIWSNGAGFDLPILRHAANKLNLNNGNPLWPFYREYCFRTMFGKAPHVRKSIQFEGVKHDPYYDNVHQIKTLVEIIKQTGPIN